MTATESLQTTCDTILGGRLHLYQPSSGFRAAIDPVLLAASVQVSPGSRILDAGCGTGAALFCVLSRLEKTHGVGVDIQANLIALAQLGVEENGFGARATVSHSDIVGWSKQTGTLFDGVITNPPYFEKGSVPPLPERDHSHMEEDIDLGQWIKECLKCLRPEGQFAIIHRAERLSDIIATLHGRAGSIRIHPLWPKQDQPAKRVIVTALKGRKSPSQLLPGLVLHNENGEYTDAANNILRFGAAL